MSLMIRHQQSWLTRCLCVPSRQRGAEPGTSLPVRLPSRRMFRLLIALLVCWTVAGNGFAQVSPEEHAKHHPEQAKGGSAGGGMSGMAGGKGGGGMMGGDKGGGKGGGMMGGGGMGGMMEKMGAPKPREMYPRLMDLPDLPMEERATIEAEAHQRMLEGTSLMSDGFDQLAGAAPSNDFAAMQAATASLREGLARFESGLAAHRAIAEGKSPRNVALQWFKREMNLLAPASVPTGFHLFGMSAFHTAVMAVLIVFAVVMVWMYFFKMRRATELMQKLATVEAPATGSGPSVREAVSSTTGSAVVASPTGPLTKRTAASPIPKKTAAASTGVADCCSDSAVACGDEETSADSPDISQGLLRVAKRKLCRLRVARIYQETGDVKTFRLVACHGGALPFSYLPGQFLTLTLPVGEKPIRRSYTISSSPTQGYYCEITVKREDQGAGSRYLHDVVAEGDMLEVQAPSGKFTFTGQEADSVVLIAGGVGITPMMSITRALTDMGWSGDIHFIAGCQDPDHFIFADELKRLLQRHPNLHVHVAMSRLQEDVDGYRSGRLSKDLLTEWVPDIASRWVHLCGAPSMMESVQQMLAELRVPADQVHLENFGSQHKPHVRAAIREQAATEVPAQSAKQAAPTVTFQASGKSAALEADDTVLEAAEHAGVDIDNSCRTGMCGVCTVKLLSGEVTMEAEDGLEPEDKAAGMILACQAKSTGDVTVEA